MASEGISTQGPGEQGPGEQPARRGATPGPGAAGWAVLAAVALVPFVFATGFSQYDSLRWIVYVGLMAVALVAWGVQVLRGRRVRIVAGKAALLAAAFGVFAAASALWSPVPLLGSVEATHWLAIVATYLLIVAPSGRPLGFGDLAAALGIGTLVTGLFGLLDLIGVGLFTVIWDPGGATGAFDAAEFAMPYYAVVLPVLAAAVIRFRGWIRWLSLAALLLGGLHFGLLADWLYLSIFGGTVAVSSVVVVVLQRFDRVILLYPVFALVGVLAVAVAVGQVIGEGAEEASDANQLPLVLRAPLVDQADIPEGRIRNPHFAIGRMETIRNPAAMDYLAEQAFSLFRDQPVVGKGVGGWWLEGGKYPAATHPFVEKLFVHYPLFRSPHNGALLVLVELGVVGLLLFAGWILSVFALTLRALARRGEAENWLVEHWALLTAALAGLAFLFVTPLVELAASAVVFAAVLGVLTRESSVLNDFEGLASVWTLDTETHRRADVLFFGAAMPALLGLAMLAPTVLDAASSLHRGRGDLLMLRTRYAGAADAYAEAHRWLPARGDVLYNQALAMQRAGELTEAADVVNEAYRLRPYDARISEMLGQLHLRTRDYDAALAAGRRAVDLFPNYIDGRRLVALSLDLQNRIGEASETLLAALERQPPMFVRATLYRELAQHYEGPLKNKAKAIEYYRKALDLYTDPNAIRSASEKVEVLEKELQRERLIREGKPIPPELMPGPAPGHDHGHGAAPELPDVPGLPRPPMQQRPPMERPPMERPPR